MAQMFPKRFPRPDDPRRWAELQVYNALAKLDDDWLVFYSVAWQSMRNGKQGDGEADFVLAHPTKGIIFAEVKGGSTIEIIDGEWYSWSQGSPKPIKSPVEQAVKSKYALQGWLSDRISGFRRNARLGHMIIFPAHDQIDDLGPDAPRAIICDKGDLDNITAAVDRVAKHWAPLHKIGVEGAKQLKDALAPTITIRRHLRHRVEDIAEDLAELTEQQLDLLGFLRHQRKAMITGGAGTGKTVIAVARARQLAEDGFRTLLLSYNRPIGDRLAEEVEGVDNVWAGSFHGLCLRIAASAGLVPDEPKDQAWWDEKLPAAMIEAAYSLDDRYDAIVVDEAQDFLPDWWTYLEMLFPNSDDGIMYIFADSNQNLYRDDWLPPFDRPPFPLDRNCRNTNQIAQRVADVIGITMDTLGVNGPEPVYKEANTDRQTEKAVTATLDRLIDTGELNPDQIVLLSIGRTQVDELTTSNNADPRLGDGTNGTVLAETVRRFKGLESDAIILVLADREQHQLKRLAYVGMSRAHSVLYVIGTTKAKELIGWK